MGARILLVGNYAPDAQESMQRFTYTLQQGLSFCDYEVRVICPLVKCGAWKGLGATSLKWLGYLDKFILFPQSAEWKAAIAWADLIHVVDQANAIYYPSIHPKPHLITCHDMLAVESSFGHYPQNQLSFTGKIYQKWILNSLKCFSYFTCDSNFTKDRLINILGILDNDTKKVSVIHIGLNYPYRVLANQSEAQKKFSHLMPFILHVGGNQWYKNRMGVLRTYHYILKEMPELRELKLIMVGKPLTQDMINFIRENGLTEAVISKVSVPNQELEELYNCAEVFLFPSLVEGFGWPVIEAQACGCPVVCSHAGPLPEVAGEGALTADPMDEAGLAACIRQVICDVNVRNHLVEKGRLNVQNFTTEKMISSFAALYQDILSKS